MNKSRIADQLRMAFIGSGSKPHQIQTTF